MSDSEYRSFMTAGTRTAKWATSRTDDRPHVVPVWFVLEGDDLLSRPAARRSRAAPCFAIRGWRCASTTNARHRRSS